MHSEKLACAPMYCYAKDYNEIKRRGPVFRLHVAGRQHLKVDTIQSFLPLVNNATQPETIPP